MTNWVISIAKNLGMCAVRRQNGEEGDHKFLGVRQLRYIWILTEWIFTLRLTRATQHGLTSWRTESDRHWRAAPPHHCDARPSTTRQIWETLPQSLSDSEADGGHWLTERSLPCFTPGRWHCQQWRRQAYRCDKRLQRLQKIFVNAFIILPTFISLEITWAKQSKIMTKSQATVHCVRSLIELIGSRC